MISTGELVVYSAVPAVMAQWHYVPHIGMEHRGANSDIHGTAKETGANPNYTDTLKPEDVTGWPDVWRTKNVWRLRDNHPDVAFTEMALQVAWEKIFAENGDTEEGVK